MCGGGGNDYVVTYEKTDIGLKLKHVKVYHDKQFFREYVEDGLLRNCACWGSPYKHDITEEDLNESALTLEANSTLEQNAKRLLNERREYMTIKTEKAEAKNTQVIKKESSCNIV
jgi:hypothetical protein